MAEKEKEVEKTNEKSNSHTAGHTPVKKTSKYRKLIERYKKRNKIVEVIILCILIVLVFVLSCNRTFLRTSYVKKVGNSEINISLPRFTYFVSSDENKIIFKTLRKSTNTRQFFDEFLETDAFTPYWCPDDNEKFYYYNEANKYFIYNIEVTKSFAIKTITVNYSTADENTFCDTIKRDDQVIDDEL